MKKIVTTMLLLSVFGLVSYAQQMSSSYLQDAAKIISETLKVDSEVARSACESSKQINIDGELYNSVKIGKDSVLIGNGGVYLLGSISAGSITNKVELDHNSKVLGNVGIVTH